MPSAATRNTANKWAVSEVIYQLFVMWADRASRNLTKLRVQGGCGAIAGRRRTTPLSAASPLDWEVACGAQQPTQPTNAKVNKQRAGGGDHDTQLRRKRISHLPATCTLLASWTLRELGPDLRTLGPSATSPAPLRNRPPACQTISATVH